MKGKSIISMAILSMLIIWNLPVSFAQTTNLPGKGANVNPQAKDGKIPLSIAPESGYGELIKRINAHGAIK